MIELADKVIFQTGDYLDEPNLGEWLGRTNIADYGERGLGFTVSDWTSPALDIGAGKAHILTNNQDITALPDARTGLALTDGDTNYVFVAVDTSLDDEIYYEINTTNSAPADTNLYLGTVDTANDTTTEENRDPEGRLRALTVTGQTTFQDRVDIDTGGTGTALSLNTGDLRGVDDLSFTDGGGPRVTNQPTAGGTVIWHDSYNNLDIARFHNGGNFEVPNGPVNMGGGWIDEAGRDHIYDGQWNSGGMVASTSYTLNNSYDRVFVDIQSAMGDDTNAREIRMRVNGDTGTNYDYVDQGGTRTTGHSYWELGVAHTTNTGASGQLQLTGRWPQDVKIYGPAGQGSGLNDINSGKNFSVASPLNSMEMYWAVGNIDIDAHVYGVNL